MVGQKASEEADHSAESNRANAAAADNRMQDIDSIEVLSATEVEVGLEGMKAQRQEEYLSRHCW